MQFAGASGIHVHIYIYVEYNVLLLGTFRGLTALPFLSAQLPGVSPFLQALLEFGAAAVSRTFRVLLRHNSSVTSSYQSLAPNLNGRPKALNPKSL